MGKRRINTLQPVGGSKLPKITILGSKGANALELDELLPISGHTAFNTKVIHQIAAGGEPPKEETPKKKRRKNEAPKFLTVEEIGRLFHAIKSIRDRAIFRIGYHAGLRASEIGMLDLRDYEARAKRIMVSRVKGSHSGEHHLCSTEHRALTAWLKERGDHPGVLFPSNRRRPIGRRRLDQLMKEYGAAAGIPPELCHFHVLKHSCATHLLSMDYGVERVQDWLGHVNIQSTMKYAKVTNPRREQMGKELRDRW